MFVLVFFALYKERNLSTHPTNFQSYSLTKYLFLIDYMAHIFESDSDESEFSGFGSSDIDVPLDENDDSDVEFSDNEDAELVLPDDDAWTQDLSPIVV